jgi:hypothetical protein
MINIDGELYDKELLDFHNDDLFLEVIDYGKTIAEQNEDEIKEYKGELYMLSWDRQKHKFYKLTKGGKK